MFANATLTVPDASSASASRSGRRTPVTVDSMSNDRSNSNNTHSQGVEDLMTDEEIPPRGEISEYEESSSNTSSFHSTHDDTVRWIICRLLYDMVLY